MRPRSAAAVARFWTRVYTAPLPQRLRDERRAEMESDLWECQADPASARQILPRLLLGAVDDVAWSLGGMRQACRAGGRSIAMVAVISIASLSLASLPATSLVREFPPLFPIVATVHLLGMIAFLGSRFIVDLRLLGWTLADVPIRILASHLMPWTVAGAALTVASGLTLYASLANWAPGNPLFMIKVGALIAALVNLGVCHAVVLRRAEKWDPVMASPLPARITASLSIVLALTMLMTGSLSSYLN